MPFVPLWPAADFMVTAPRYRAIIQRMKETRMIHRLSLAAALVLALPAAAQDRVMVSPPGMPLPPPGMPLPPPGPGGKPVQFMLQRTLAPPALLSLSASADVARVPDQVRLTAAVVNTAATAAEAMAANAARMTAVLAALKAAGVAERDVQTTGLSLNPQYRYQPEQAPILTGYQARNAISLRTARLADAGKLVDAAIKAGANEVQGPEFGIANPDAALDEARTAAVAKARARAELYAKAAGLKVKRIVSISEGAGAPEPGPRPLLRSAMVEAAAPPVQPGELSLSAQVSVTFELEPQP